MLTGGCYCGDLRYETDGTPFSSTFCHCAICRRTIGAPVVAWFSVPAATFRMTVGTPSRFRATPIAERAFCSRCGAHVTFRQDGSDEIDIATASLDDAASLPPTRHIWTSLRLPWMKTCGALPEYRQNRDDS